MIGLRALVLTNTYMPLSVFPDLSTIPVEDAIHRYLNGNCDVVSWYDRPILTPSRTDLYWPSIIVNHVNKRVTNDKVRLKNETLFYRDHGICAYCETQLDLRGNKDNPNKITKDHVKPISKGGTNEWDNVVASCKKCNSLKGDSLPVGKWKPKRKPWSPNFYQLLEIRKKFPLIVDDPEWIQFLPNWIGEVNIRNHNGLNHNNLVQFDCVKTG